MSETPFYFLKPVEEIDRFYGRHSEVGQALEILRRSENLEVTGPRKIGRTSFLHYISHPMVLQQFGMDPSRHLFVYVDCQSSPLQGEESQVYEAMFARIMEVASKVGVHIGPELWDRKRTGITFARVLKDMSRQGLRTVLLFDEFELMARNPKLSASFFNNLRALASETDIDVAYVTASRTHLVDLCLERESVLTSPFFNIFLPIRLGLFSDAESRRLVESELERAGVLFPNEVVELVLEMGGGYPFFLQMAGYHAFELLGTGDAWTEDKRKLFQETVEAEASSHFKYYWQNLSPHEHYVLSVLPVLWRDPIYQGTIERLRDQCLIARRDDKYGYFSTAFEEFVRRQRAEGVLRVGPLLVDERRQQVFLRGEPLSLSPTNYALLTYLMERYGLVVSSRELDREVLWRSREYREEYQYLGDERLKSAIKELRKALGRDAQYIVHMRGIGYSLQTTESHLAGKTERVPRDEWVRVKEALRQLGVSEDRIWRVKEARITLKR
jgi:DNA-binding winged helix-turn-helix (wHTH) protein